MPFPNQPLLVGLLTCLSANAYAAKGFDTLGDNLPFSINGSKIMELTDSGLNVSGGTIRPMAATPDTACPAIGTQSYNSSTGAPMFCNASLVWTPVMKDPVQITNKATEGAACNGEGTLGQSTTTSGQVLACQSSVWTKLGGGVSSIFTSYNCSAAGATTINSFVAGPGWIYLCYK